MTKHPFKHLFTTIVALTYHDKTISDIFLDTGFLLVAFYILIAETNPWISFLIQVLSVKKLDHFIPWLFSQTGHLWNSSHAIPL